MIYLDDAIDAVYKCADIFAGDMPVMVVKADAYEALAQLPSAQPELAQDLHNACTDTISRQAAIDALFGLYEYQRDIDPTEAADLVRQGIYLAEKKIDQLPSVQPEVLACGEGELSAQPEITNEEIRFALKQLGAYLSIKIRDKKEGSVPVELLQRIKEIQKYVDNLPSVQPETHDKRTETHACDLIDRQAALDALAKFVPYAICDESTESYTNGLKDAYDLICQLPSAQPDPPWILCSEKMPEEHERVLATHLGGLNPDRQVIEHIYKNGKFTLGWDMDMNMDSPTFGQRYMGKVVAWMPLPKPYKEGDAK